MRPGKIEQGEALAAIREVFREHGFDGASLTLLAGATGLRRASLYHRFPDGKDGMAVAAIEDLALSLESEVFARLDGAEPWQERLRVMIGQLDAYYDGGQTPCLLAAFSFGATPAPARHVALRIVTQWQDRLAGLAAEAGQPAARAAALAEQAIVEIQGGLIVAALTGDPAPFRRVLARLPALIAGEPQ
jgi:AcrR family transcriptional regulator